MTSKVSDTSTMVNVDNLSMLYRVPREKYSGIKEFAIMWMQRRVEYVDHWALRDVSFNVAPGEILGVIGPNGAGKSTLLKVIAGVLQPAEGRVQVGGSIAPLLGLGAGFHPELTGRENVYLYGALLGHTREEMKTYFEEIAAFAELDDFIDSPLRTYSSGMTLRLGFSVATCQFADVLLVDEVLAVGDERFRAKCLDRMHTFREQSATILYVSHDMSSVTATCTNAMWMDAGAMRAYGPAQGVVHQYIEHSKDGSEN